jgi:hypothetical protein
MARHQWSVWIIFAAWYALIIGRGYGAVAALWQLAIKNISVFINLLNDGLNVHGISRISCSTTA